MKNFVPAAVCVLFVTFIAAVAVASPVWRVLPENSSGMWTVVSAVSETGATIKLHLVDVDDDSHFGSCEVPAKPFVQAGYFPQPGDTIGENWYGIDYYGSGRGSSIQIKQRMQYQTWLYHRFYR